MNKEHPAHDRPPLDSTHPTTLTQTGEIRGNTFRFDVHIWPIVDEGVDQFKALIAMMSRLRNTNNDNNSTSVIVIQPDATLRAQAKQIINIMSVPFTVHYLDHIPDQPYVDPATHDTGDGTIIVIIDQESVNARIRKLESN